MRHAKTAGAVLIRQAIDRTEGHIADIVARRSRFTRSNMGMMFTAASYLAAEQDRLARLKALAGGEA